MGGPKRVVVSHVGVSAWLDDAFVASLIANAVLLFCVGLWVWRQLYLALTNSHRPFRYRDHDLPKPDDAL